MHIYTYTHIVFMYIHIYIFYTHTYIFYIHTHTYPDQGYNSIAYFFGMPRWSNIVKLQVPELTSSMIIALMLRLGRLVWNLFRTRGVEAELHCYTKKKAPYNFTESRRAAKWYYLENAQSNSHCVNCLISLSVSKGMSHESVEKKTFLSTCNTIKIYEWVRNRRSWEGKQVALFSNKGSKAGTDTGSIQDGSIFCVVVRGHCSRTSEQDVPVSSHWWNIPSNQVFIPNSNKGVWMEQTIFIHNGSSSSLFASPPQLHI